MDKEHPLGISWGKIRNITIYYLGLVMLFELAHVAFWGIFYFRNLEKKTEKIWAGRPWRRSTGSPDRREATFKASLAARMYLSGVTTGVTTCMKGNSASVTSRNRRNPSFSGPGSELAVTLLILPSTTTGSQVCCAHHVGAVMGPCGMSGSNRGLQAGEMWDASSFRNYRFI